ncbi:sensor histidine kinase [uncultured Flavonifractor sp.]|uniref:sensor histidine kinase n=1 Tax=uncultured Flavonifractor sp. TaxID=1193534 RepID=UPI00261574BF|nr:ATP-binding protein [uncultured Flavonifractor sp.]
MEDKRLFFNCLAGKLAVFLLLWAAVMAALVWVNYRWCQEDVVQQYSDLPMRIRTGEVTFSAQPKDLGIVRFLPWEDGYCSAQLTMMGEHLLRDYGGQLFLRIYEKDGDRLGQTQMLVGYTGMTGETDPEEDSIVYLVFDPAMTDEEMLAALEILNGYPKQVFYRYDDDVRPRFTGVQAVGWREGEALYVQKLTLLFETGEVVLADTEADLFPGRAPESYSGTWVEFYSPLLGRGDPEPQLERYRALEAEVDEIEETFPRWPQEGLAYGGGWNSNAYLVAGAVRPLASNYSLPKLYALTGLEPMLLLTLGMAAALSLFTAWLEYRAIRRERAFTRAAAHELKTPLAILRTHAEALREDIDPEKRGEYLDVVLSETDRMAALTAALLDLARLERGEALNREPLELSALVKGVLDRLALPLAQKGIALSLDLSQVWTEGDRSRLESVAANLASNALRHCPPGGTVAVRAGKEGRWAVLTVDNDGEPIPEKDLSRIWEPFYRSDRSRSRDTGGTGLGLAIVKAAVKAHGGEYGVSNRAGGVTFRVSLPCLQSAQ